MEHNIGDFLQQTLGSTADSTHQQHIRNQQEQPFVVSKSVLSQNRRGERMKQSETLPKDAPKNRESTSFVK